jgi:MinD-like ATPase involved in chromosome partitioning or flagellar assembly/tetratricopeptide (TPR) repeat protein
MPNAEENKSPYPGQVVTFYSFKGGTGRTMALANVAWILAANGKRVLVADWDLESPGLYRFFQPFLDANVDEKPGIVDFVRRYEWAAVDAGMDPDTLHTRSEEPREAARAAVTAIVDEYVSQVANYTIPLSWEFPDDGVLHFLTSGKQTGHGDYETTLSALDWDNFYDNLNGGQFFDALRGYMKSNYDYVLIDSRTGLSDVADICTVHLPDIVVDCFTLATQGIEGAALIARMIQQHTERDITIYPVPMRIDHTQRENVDAGLALAIRKFQGLPAGFSDDERDRYWSEVEVPYRPSYAYEEMLATIGDRPGSQAGLLSSYERLSARITNGAVSALPPKEEWLRLRTRLLFSRTQSRPFVAVLDYSPQDQLWAEWIAAVLASAEITVRWVSELPADHDDSDAETQIIAVVSESSITRMQDSPPAIQPDIFVSVTEARLPAEFSDMPLISLAGLSEGQAVERLVTGLKGRYSPSQELENAALRYPGGSQTQVQKIPGRNVNFTGRDKALMNLREQLESRDVTSLLPLTIQGLGGIGKTQLALEYAYRFRANYDIIWWMDCGQAQYADASLVDLGQRVRESFKADIPEEGGVAEIVQQVLDWLSKNPNRRWLLVYDNADDIGEIRRLLPLRHDSARLGGGHVLITSTNERWISVEKFRSLEVDVFEREESIDHLRRRVPGISEAEADDLAGVLGDMPLAVAAAGALLATADIPVPEYLRQLRLQPEPELAEGDPLQAYPPEVWKAWNLSLDYLQEKSAAAARLLGICSVMAPDISLELINSQAMADNLRDLDPRISERAMINRLIRQIDLLALIKLDNNAQQIQVHRVVQSVVNGRLTKEERTAARHAVHQVVVAAQPDGDVDDPRTWPRYRTIWPHLTPSGAMWSGDTAVRELLIERVRYIWIRDDLGRGLRRAREIERAWMTMLAGHPDSEMPASREMVTGELDPKVAESLQRQLYRLQFNLANILRSLDDFQEARALDEAVLSGQRGHLGEEHVHTLQTRSSLAADMRALGEYQEALSYDLETYRLWNTGYGEEYRGSLGAAHNLAVSYLLTGDFRRALAHDRVTLERRKSVLGALHSRTLGTGTSLARDLLEAGRYKEAADQIEEVWVQCRSALGDRDRVTLNAQLLFGVAQRCAGRPDKAEELIDTAKAGLTTAFGANHSDALSSRLSQGLNWLALERYAEGRTVAEGVLVVYETRLGSGHPHSLICRLNISTALYLEGEYQAARAEAQYAVDGLSSLLGPAHPYTLAAGVVLACVLARQDELATARGLEDGIAKDRELHLGSEHPDTLRAQLNLLLTEHDLRIEGALERRQAIIAKLGAQIGAHHPDVTTAINGNRLLSAIDPLPF